MKASTAAKFPVIVYDRGSHIEIEDGFHGIRLAFEKEPRRNAWIVGLGLRCTCCGGFTSVCKPIDYGLN